MVARAVSRAGAERRDSGPLSETGPQCGTAGAFHLRHSIGNCWRQVSRWATWDRLNEAATAHDTMMSIACRGMASQADHAEHTIDRTPRLSCRGRLEKR